MAMACRENATSEEVNQLKEVIQQLRGAVSTLSEKLKENENVKRPNRRTVVSRPCAVSVKMKMNRFDTPNPNVSRKIPNFRSIVLKKRIYIVN